MRVTNSMISNSSQIHIGNAKTELMKRQNQYTTQKKIQRPSDDPTVAIRSLQLRTSYAQIRQYADKNIQDAMDWMDSTEGALKAADGILTDMRGYLEQGANDPLEAKDREKVLKVLQQFTSNIFADNANNKFSDRYLFTGYRTDTSLLFSEGTSNFEYEIHEQFDSTNINSVKVVTGGARFDSSSTDADYAADAPAEAKVYRIALAYKNCLDTEISSGNAVTTNGIALQVSGMTPQPTVVTMSSQSVGAYEPADSGIHYIADTGELILGKDVYDTIQATDAEINVTYAKKEFEKNDIRPEMYFECTRWDISSSREIYYADPSGQDIRYEINFSQTGSVNTQAKDAFSTDIYRTVDYIEQTVNAVNEVENRIADIEKKINNTSDPTELRNYKKLKEVLEQEKSLRSGVMQEAFSKGLTMVQEAQDKLNVAWADAGARYKRLQLTSSKLDDQKTDIEQKLSNNEDVDIADAYINLTQADNLYQASLSATAKILGNSLLNYI